MKAVIQRVKEASVSIGGETRIISKGYVVLLGIMKNDNNKDINYLCRKIINLRLFESKEDSFGKSLTEIAGNVLIIPQFTLFADTEKGRKPYFGSAESPRKAEKVYKSFVGTFKDLYTDGNVETGEFGRKMIVNIANNGPVTIILDSRKIL